VKDIKKELELAEIELKGVQESYRKAQATIANLEVIGIKLQGKVEALKSLLNEPEGKVVKKEIKEVK